MIWENAGRAIQLVKEILRDTHAFDVVRGPSGNGPVDVLVVYNGLAIDIIHYDPYNDSPSPKGRPVEYLGDIDSSQVLATINRVLREAYVLEAAEYREPERAWIVPVGWRNLIIMHVKVEFSGGGLVVDPQLQKRLRELARP